MFGHFEENVAMSRRRGMWNVGSVRTCPGICTSLSDTPGSLQIFAAVIQLLKFLIPTILVLSSPLFPHLLAIVAFLHGAGELKI